VVEKRKETAMTAEIGATAGEIWHLLKSGGETSWRQIEKRIGRPQRLVAMGIGWLAREEKVEIREEAGVYYVSLKA
jgi:hypothetical protein